MTESNLVNLPLGSGFNIIHNNKTVTVNGLSLIIEAIQPRIL